MTRLRSVALLALTTALTTTLACEQPAPPQPTPDSASSSKNAGPDSPAVGGRMGEVAKQLEKRSGMSADELAKQPPVTGIFPEGVADKAHGLKDPPKLEMISEGNDPKIKLHSSVPEVQTLVAKMQLRLQGRPISNRTVFIEIAPPELAGKTMAALEEASRKPEEPKAAGSAKPATSAPAASGSVSASAAPVVEAPPSPAVPVIPPGADRPMVATVMDVGGGGSDFNATITFTITKSGAMSFVRKFSKPITDPKEALTRDVELGAIEELLVGLFTGIPDKPVGEKAQWTIVDRRTSFGSDVVRYRLFQVQKIEGDQAALQVMVRQYAASDTTSLVDNADIILGGYAFGGQGAIQIGPKKYFPNAGALKIQMQGNLIPKTAKGDPNVPGEDLDLDATIQVQEAMLGPAPDQAPPPDKDPKKDGKAAPSSAPPAGSGKAPAPKAPAPAAPPPAPAPPAG